MGYPIFGKVKTIVLPNPTETLTLKEYKEKFGIDLLEFVKHDSTTITYKEPNSNILLLNENTDMVHTLVPFINHSSGLSESVSFLWLVRKESPYLDGEDIKYYKTGLYFEWNNTTEFNEDNIKVSYMEE